MLKSLLKQQADSISTCGGCVGAKFGKRSSVKLHESCAEKSIGLLSQLLFPLSPRQRKIRIALEGRIHREAAWKHLCPYNTLLKSVGRYTVRAE
jgi:hypothetical protein